VRTEVRKATAIEEVETPERCYALLPLNHIVTSLLNNRGVGHERTEPRRKACLERVRDYPGDFNMQTVKEGVA